METGKVIQSTLMLPENGEQIFSAEEKKRLADFFAVLMDIDRRVNITKVYDKPTK